MSFRDRGRANGFSELRAYKKFTPISGGKTGRKKSRVGPESIPSDEEVSPTIPLTF